MQDPCVDSTRIYRIVSFYEVLNIIRTKRFRIGSARRFKDPDELFGHYIFSHFNEFSLFGKTESPDNFINNIRISSYVTSWTRVSDNIAIWEMYGNSKDNVMISTTYGKLKKFISNFYYKNSFSISKGLPPNSRKMLFSLFNFGPVLYCDFYKIVSDVLDFYKEYDTDLGNLVSSGGWSVEDVKVLREDFFEKVKSLGISYDKIALLKDSRYYFEKEVRGFLFLVFRNDESKEEFESNPLYPLYDPIRKPREEECPLDIFIPVNSDFIEEVIIDQRCPNYIYEEIKEVLSRLEIAFSISNAFSPLCDRTDLYNKLKDYYL